ncbi:MAG: hypothetical protein JWN86_3920 [Planctomycetota bacterium]|nr:hypothetical protein [Planctomycetota bacterium]
MKIANSLFACAGAAAAMLAAGLFFAAPSPTASAANPPVVAIATLVPGPVAGYGTIKGRLVYSGDAPALLKIDVKNQPFCQDQTIVDRSVDVDPKTKGVANAIVWLVAPKGKNPGAEKALVAKTPKVQIDNKNCAFVPRSTAIFKGQSIEFTSSDPVGHNSHVTGFSNGVNVALAPKGKAAAKLASEKRPMSLKCDIHPWMQGYVLVSDHPFFAVTGPDGSFEIAGVPAGTQNVIVWQEKAGYVTEGAAKGKAVEVKADGTADMGDITLDAAKIKK